jgi:hypothetical protein
LAKGKLSISGDVTGIGTLKIEQLKMLELGGSAADQKIVFAAGKLPRATLILDNPGDSFGKIYGFQKSDVIDLKGVIGATDSFSGGVLTVRDGSNTIVSTLNFAGSFAGLKFALSSDGSGGTDISLVKAAAGAHTALQVARLSEAVAAHGDRPSASSALALDHRPETAAALLAGSLHH